LDDEKIIALKSLINHTLANHKPQDNKVFEQEGVKNKLILLNYLLDMEDLYYESGKQSEADNALTHCYEEPLKQYIQRFPPFTCRDDLERAGLWNHPVIVDKSWNKYERLIKNKQDGHIGWDESTITLRYF